MIKHFPVATVTAVITTALAALTALVGTGVLTERQAAIVGAVIAVGNIVLGALAHRSVTPLASPRDAEGRPLSP